MVVSDNNHSPSTKRRRCLIGEERKLAGPDTEVAPSNNRTESQPARPPTKQVCTIFLGGLHPRIVEAHIEKMCMPYGTIQRLHLMDRKGYAFCQYSSPSEAAAAIQALDGRGLLGRRLMVRPAHNDQHHHVNSSVSNSNNNAFNSNNRQSINNAASSSNPQKEKERVEERIRQLKRKIEQTKSVSK